MQACCLLGGCCLDLSSCTAAQRHHPGRTHLCAGLPHVTIHWCLEAKSRDQPLLKSSQAVVVIKMKEKREMQAHGQEVNGKSASEPLAGRLLPRLVIMYSSTETTQADPPLCAGIPHVTIHWCLRTQSKDQLLPKSSHTFRVSLKHNCLQLCLGDDWMNKDQS